MALSFEEGLRALGKLIEQNAHVGLLDPDESVSGALDTSVPGLLQYNPLNNSIEEDSDNVFSMVSAARKKANVEDEAEGALAQQYMTVTLPDQKKDEFFKFFYHKDDSPKVVGIFSELAKLSAQVNGFFALLRYGLADATRFAMMTPAQRSDVFNDEAERIIKAISAMSPADVTKDFLKSISKDGNKHVIVPSRRHKGGFDFDFIGPLTSVSGAATSAEVGSLLIPFRENNIYAFSSSGKSNDAYYQRKVLEAYSTELSLGLIRTGKQITEMLCGEKAVDPKSAASREVKQLPFSYDFEKLNDIFFDNTGITLRVKFVTNIPAAINTAYGSFFSILCIRTPSSTVVSDVLDTKSREKSRGKLNNVRNGTPDAAIPPMNLDSFLEERVLPEGLALSQALSFSASLSIDEELARFITQAESGSKIPLLSLHNWMTLWSRNVLKPFKGRVVGGSTRPHRLPRVIIPLSKAQGITDLRIKNGMAVENGKGDSNNIFVATDGSLTYGLSAQASEVATTNIQGYETDMEKYLSYCFEHGMTAQTSSVKPTELNALTGEHVDDSDFSELNASMRKYAGKLLSFNWDYNVVLTSKVDNPSAMVPKDLIGAAKPDDLVLADYLGLDFANPGEAPIQKTFADTMILMQNYPLFKGSDTKAPQSAKEVIGYDAAPSVFLGEEGKEDKSFVGGLLSYYKFLLYTGKVPNATELVTEAAKELGLQDQDVLDARQNSVSNTVIDWKSKSAYPFYQSPTNIMQFLADCLRSCLTYSAGGYMLKRSISDENPNISSDELKEMVREHEDYFSPGSTAADFGRLYSLLPGMVWKLAMQHIVDLDPKVIFAVERDVQDENTNDVLQPSYNVLTTKILPQAVLFAKYIPSAPEIMERAKEAQEQNKPDPSIDESDIKIPGSNDNAQMFPHQVDTHRSLRKRPKWAFLAISAGGGKTSLGVTDIACMIQELNELGEKNIRPLILCPDNLIKNWVDDMKIFTDNRWNMLPINSKIVNRWGYDELDAIIKNAPINTIVVAGFYFLKAKAEPISIGTHQFKISNNLEFIKRYGFDYICIDESHKLKNKKSAVHKTVKQLTTASIVKYIRLCSGTMISNVVTDIIGQAALCNGHIIREDEITGSGAQSSVDGEAVPHWQVGMSARIRTKLSNYGALIVKKKKEWAFMLPNPIEHFYAVKLVPTSEGGASERDIELGELHQQLYDTVLAESEEELKELIAKAKKVKGGDDDDDDDDDEGEEGDGETTEDYGLSGDDEFAKIGQADLEPYLQRIERLITNPMRDPAFAEVFGAAGITEYHSRKATFIVSLIDRHFNPPKWEKGTNYKEFTLVSHAEKLYFSRKLDKGSPTPELLPSTTVGKPPNIDTDTWKEEPEGKVIVFCRYNYSVEGVFNALPAHYQKIAVRYTGAEDNKLVNLDAFIDDSRIKILIANEQGLSEGHNFQFASRIIRVESPWAPGELEQTSSRIFRPDPKAAKSMRDTGKPGELYREAVFLDWVLADNTMEVPKQARLIHKIIQNAEKFDEADNPLYEGVFESCAGKVSKVSMGLDLLRSRASLEDDYDDYTKGYAGFKAVQREEFHDMRLHGDSTMLPIAAHPEMKGSKKIRTPFVSGQKFSEDGLNVISLRNLLRSPDHADLLANINKLRGLPVITDHGPGRIAKFRPRQAKRAKLDASGEPIRLASGKLSKENVVDVNGNPVLDERDPISSVDVVSSETQTVMGKISDIGTIFVVLGELTSAQKKRFNVNSLSITQAEIKKENRAGGGGGGGGRSAAAEQKRREKEEQDEDARLIAAERKRRAEEKRAAEARAAQAEGKKRKKNIAEGKPINAGISVVTTPPPRGLLVDAVKTPSKERHITLHPALVQGFLTLEIKAEDPDAKLLQKFDFKHTGSYAYVDTTLFRRYSKIFDYLENNFDIPKAYFDMLEEVQDAFDSDKNGGIYKMEMAPESSLKYFFASRKTPAKDRNQIRPFPIIFPDFLRIAVDIKTNPGIRTHISKPIPGAVAKWQEAAGHYLFFSQSKGALRDKVAELKKAGFIIDNASALAEEIKNISFRAARAPK
jgi:hypothetical protein